MKQTTMWTLLVFGTLICTWIWPAEADIKYLFMVSIICGQLARIEEKMPNA